MRENQKKGRNFKGEPVEPQIEKAREHLINSYGLSEEYAGSLGDADSRRHDHNEGGPVGHREKVSPVGTPKGRITNYLTAETGDSRNQIYRYIRLTELIPELLQLVDDGLIGMRPAVELSYLAQKQRDIYAIIDREQLTPTHAQTIRMRKLFAEGKLTTEAIEEILLEEKPNQIEHVSIRVDKIKAYLPKDLPKARREEYIIEALRFYCEHSHP
jgi:ParB family chromosome partitioning protein